MSGVDLICDPVRKKARRRARVIAAILGLWVIGIFARLIELQIFGHARALARVVEQNQGREEIIPRRGTIFDRNGRILAHSLPASSVYYRPNYADVPDARWEPVRRLQAALGLGAADLHHIRTQMAKKARFIWIKRLVEPEVAARVVNARSGIWARPEPKRFYPLGTLATHVLGGVGVDGVGSSGIEYKLDGILAGRKGQALILEDARGRDYRYEILEEPQEGRDVVLTLDGTLQYIAQRELDRAIAETRAAWGTVILSQPATGEILAMAVSPLGDPRRPSSAPEADFNRAVRQTYEPGSTFKVVLAAAALENRRATVADRFDCRTGLITLPGGPIRDIKRFGVLSFSEVFINSSNVGTVQVSQRVGAGPFYRMIEAFGFGRRTGIELPAEEPGRVAPPERWSKRSLASLSIGYEIMVTPLQMLQAINVVARRGELVPPRIVRSIVGGRPRAVPAPRTVLSREACEKLIGILERVVLEGTGKEAAAAGYEIAGKTGTAQKYDPELKAYSSRRHLASFIGFVPADKPVLSMVVVLDDPRVDAYTGGQLAAPVFREIARRALRYLRVYPRLPAGPAGRRDVLQEGGRP